MLRSQELQLRESEIRQRLNELAGKETLTTEERAEVDTLSAELSTVATQYRAAVQAEDGEAREHRAASDGEGAECGRLTREVRCANYLQAALETRALDGREAELNAAVGLRGANEMPWEALLPAGDPARRGPEERADDAITAPNTGLPTGQDTILSRVFARTAAAYLRVGMPTVGTGQASYPVFATGATAEMAAKAGTVDADAATFTASVLKPKRLSAAYLFSLEDLLETMGLEEALREDLAMVMGDQIDIQVLRGDGAGANIAGFVGGHADGLALTGAAATAAVDFDGLRDLYLERVDGGYAQTASEIRLLVNPSLYQAAGNLYRTGADDSISALQSVMELGGGFRVSANMPANDNNKRADTLACRGDARAAVAPMWQGVRFIRDEITNANKGQVRLTAIAFWNFAITRKAQYARVNIQSGA